MHLGVCRCGWPWVNPGPKWGIFKLKPILPCVRWWIHLNPRDFAYTLWCAASNPSFPWGVRGSGANYGTTPQFGNTQRRDAKGVAPPSRECRAVSATCRTRAARRFQGLLRCHSSSKGSAKEFHFSQKGGVLRFFTTRPGDISGVASGRAFARTIVGTVAPVISHRMVDGVEVGAPFGMGKEFISAAHRMLKRMGVQKPPSSPSRGEMKVQGDGGCRFPA